MNIEKMKMEILNAIKNREVSARIIDKIGKGANITRIRRGESVSETKVQEIYKKLEEKRSGLEETLLEEPRGKLEENNQIFKALEETRGKLEESLEENTRLKKEITTYEIRVVELKEQLKELEEIQQKRQEKTREKVLGFTLVQKSDHGKLYWYAFKMYRKKMCWVYIGKEKSEARVKIEEWMTKRGMKVHMFM